MMSQNHHFDSSPVFRKSKGVKSAGSLLMKEMNVRLKDHWFPLPSKPPFPLPEWKWQRDVWLIYINSTLLMVRYHLSSQREDNQKNLMQCWSFDDPAFWFAAIAKPPRQVTCHWRCILKEYLFVTVLFHLSSRKHQHFPQGLEGGNGETTF